jgi:hypothetical protein
MACGECLFRDTDNRSVIVLPQATVANLYDKHGFRVETIIKLLQNLHIGQSNVSEVASDSKPFKLLIVGAIPTSQTNPTGMAFIMSSTTLLPLLKAIDIKPLANHCTFDTTKCFNDIGKEVATRYSAACQLNRQPPETFKISLAEWKALQPDIANHIETAIARIDIGNVF